MSMIYRNIRRLVVIVLYLVSMNSYGVGSKGDSFLCGRPIITISAFTSCIVMSSLIYKWLTSHDVSDDQGSEGEGEDSIIGKTDKGKGVDDAEYLVSGIYHEPNGPVAAALKSNPLVASMMDASNSTTLEPTTSTTLAPTTSTKTSPPIPYGLIVGLSIGGGC